MKSLRVLVLLLFCVLLPLRGAVGAVMVCAEPGQMRGHAAGHAHPGAQAGGHAHADAASAHAHTDAHADHADHALSDQGTAESEDGGRADSCHLCASGCHAAALVTALPSTPGALPVAAAVFPALHVPVPDFESEGQDRPPRAS